MASSSSSSSSRQDESVDFSALLPQRQIELAVAEWIDADIPSFDVGGFIFGRQQQGTAYLYMKSPGVFAGRPFFEATFKAVGCDWEWNDELAVEGSFIDPSTSMDGNNNNTNNKNAPTGGGAKVILATVHGPVARILQGERTALNTLSRCSGVATAARAAVTVARNAGWPGWVAGTRKTTPGNFRMVEKYGLLVGGAATHRLDLSQMVMLKDNHVVAAGGSITAAVQRARMAAGFSQKIEVECQSLPQAEEAAAAGADIVMLDNFSPERLRVDAFSFKQKYPHVLVEASGGITADSMKEYFCDSVDIISQGRLTQGYECIDFSLKIV